MAERTRSFGAEDTLLGSLSTWPDVLVWSLNTMLESRFPASVFWGPEMLHFYNDAYVPLAAEKHPELLARPAAIAWAEAWHIIGPQFESVFNEGTTVYQENVLVPVLREGVLKNIYWTYSYSPLRTPQGDICGILIVCHDVTREINATRERDAIAVDLKSVLDSITDGLLIVDREWRYTYFNEQGAAMIGMAPEDLLGRCVWDLFPAAQGTRFYEGYHRAIDSGEPVHFEEFYPAPLDKWLECHCYPSPSGLSVYFRDITKRKQREADLQRSEEQYRTLFSSMDEGYCVIQMIFDATGQPVDWTFLEVNPAFEKHNGLPNATGKRILEIVPDIEPEWFRVYGQVAHTGQPARFQQESPALQRWFDLYAFPIGEAGGNKVAVLFTDISARKKTEAALVRSEKLAAVGRMAATISHEINNPLEAVTNLLYLIRTAADASEMRTLARSAEDELARVSHITTHTLRFHRQSHAASIERLSTLLDATLMIYERRLSHQGIHLVRDYAERDHICCFASEVRQVIANLIGNAIDATRTGGIIRLRTRPQTNPHSGEKGVRLTIADSGHGMSNETLRRVFEPFFSTKGNNGTGLGLWISNEILVRHHASIRVRSRQKPTRSGTTFAIWFPSDRSPKQDATAKASLNFEAGIAMDQGLGTRD